MSATPPFAVVLRLSGFRYSQADLEELLKTSIERYSQDDGGYAQIAMEGGEPDWQTIDAFLQKCGPALKGLRNSEGLGVACLDLAYEFSEGLALASRTVPARTAALAGSHSIDLMLSIYLSSH